MSTVAADIAAAASPPRRLKLGAGAGGARRLQEISFPVAGIVCGLAWVLMVLAEMTGLARYLDHDAMVGRGTPAWPGSGLFVVGWLVMVAAMMLPALMPALARSQHGPDVSSAARATFLGGFALVWAVAGLAVLGLDGVVHRLVDGVPAIADRPWMVAALLLGVAGTAQLAPFTRGRIDASTVVAVPPTAGSAFSAGRVHGATCLGADGPLMLVAFVAGGTLGWMALLTALMTAERSSRFGNRVSACVGVALMAGAVLMVMTPSWLGPLFGAVR